MNNLLYFLIPTGCYAACYMLNNMYRYHIAKKTDIRSRIKTEAHQAHYEEDHNRRFFNNEDSMFLWEPATDEGIKRKLKHGIADKEKYEQN